MDDLFRLALKAKLPFIGVETDDIVNVKPVVQALAGKKVMPLPTALNSTVGNAYVYLSDDAKAVTPDMYRKLCESNATAILVNVGVDLTHQSRTLVFDAGVLMVPREFHESYLKEFVDTARMPSITSVLQGLSLKAAQDIVQITMARTGAVTPKDIRRTRMMLQGMAPGLFTLDPDYDFYVWPKELEAWVKLNDKYFTDPAVPEKLAPRGLLLIGPPGVGKSMAASVLSKHWDVPLYRLDIPTSLNRYQGESETRMAANLQRVEADSPCVFLLDEVEKIFSTSEEGSPTRMLSQLLWFLQNRHGRVMTIMTSNDITKLPHELYRPGRVDRVMDMPKLTLMDAKSFALGVYQNIMNKVAPTRRRKTMFDALDSKHEGTLSHADVTETVYELIKARDWLGRPDDQAAPTKLSLVTQDGAPAIATA
jgi:hypothetical protein